MTRPEALIALLALTPAYEAPRATSARCTWLPPGRQRWPRGEALKRDLATAYVAWRGMGHVGEYEIGCAVRARGWRRA